MTSSFTPLLRAWALSIIIIFGGVMTLEYTYAPPADDVIDQNAPITADADHEPVTDGTEPHDTDGDTAAEAPAADAGDLAETTEVPADAATLPAPGQTAAIDTPATEAEIAPAGLPIKPLVALIENTREGPLPIIAADGRQSYTAYAAPRNTDISLSRIAILVTDLGKKANTTRRAIEELPGTISLAFSVYGRDLHNLGQQARRAGHEIFLAVPMEPTGYPQNDPGSLTLLTRNAPSQNARLLRSSLVRLSGYVGVVNLSGSRFTAASNSIRPVLDELKRRGLMFVDNRESKYSRAAIMAKGINMPWAVNNRYVDSDLDADQISAQLALLEQRAKTQGAALGLARSYPISVRVIKAWAETLNERGFVLVPVTSIANQQALPR